MPKGFAACLNIVCRKIVCFKKLHFRGSCSTDSSILIKNTFDSIVQFVQFVQYSYSIVQYSIVQYSIVQYSLYFLISFSTTGLFDLSILHAYAMMKLLTVRNINALCYITIVITYKDYYVYYILPFHNKNTLTGPANCKKTTRHHAHLSCAKSMKINDGKSRK